MRALIKAGAFLMWASSSKGTSKSSEVSLMFLQPCSIRKTGKEGLGHGRMSWWLYCGSERGCVVDGEQLSAGRVVVEVGNQWNSWREEMGEWRVDSCTEVNRRSLCVLPTKKICDHLSVSVSLIGIMENFWVGAKLRRIGGSHGRGEWGSDKRGEPEDFNVL